MSQYGIPGDWVLVASLDESGSYEIDLTEIYFHEGKFILATASGCSCWDGEYDIEEFDSLDALADSIGVLSMTERSYHPSLRGATELLAEARAWVAAQ